MTPPPVRGVLEVALYGPELDALERFYTRVFAFAVLRRVPGRMVALRCGYSALLLFDPEATRAGGAVPGHGAAGPGHVAFVMADDEVEAWRRHLAAHDVVIEREVSWAEGGVSLYVRDPAGNSVELAPPTIWGGLGWALLRGRAPPP
jgi:catechol 2,3-dioxygenase-like lactoylglutathione lyase family enzyme